VVGVKHTYLDLSTQLTKRTSISSDGVTITKEKATLENVKKDDFPTSMHIDTFRLRYGLTDYLELFADVGFGYDELPDSEFVYGLGARMNLFERTVMGLGEFYGALQGEYMAGEKPFITKFKSFQFRFRFRGEWASINPIPITHTGNFFTPDDRVYIKQSQLLRISGGVFFHPV